ncbi:MAG: hypothetical protein JNL97_01425, partial [Verrucomicrobiales bacterium]|nr:hypothetical protein [Verrucomicrobiales bacterium]
TTLAFADAKPGDAALYQLRVRNAYGTALSQAARVTVTTSSGDPYTAWAAAQRLPENARLPGQDADLDGVSNLIEFVLGTPPLTPTPDDLPTPVVVTRNGAGFLGYEIRTRVAGSVRFTLEASTDLSRWSLVEARTETASNGDDGDVIRIFDTESLLGGPHRFVRLGVALQTPSGSPATLRVLPGPPVAASFRITVEGDPGRTYLLQGSDDLMRWNLLREVVAAATPVTITDDTLGGARYRFYRAVPR